MDLQIEKETLQEYSTKVKTNASALLWVIGTTVAAFILYAVVVVVAVSFPSPDEQTSHSMRSDIAFYGGMLIPIFLPAIFLHWRKIRLGKTATTALTVLCSISLIIDLLCDLRFLQAHEPVKGGQIFQRLFNAFVTHPVHERTGLVTHIVV